MIGPEPVLVAEIEHMLSPLICKDAPPIWRTLGRTGWLA
jgi:hypothetical protein